MRFASNINHFAFKVKSDVCYNLALYLIEGAIDV
jgi:hypothetical protein